MRSLLVMSATLALSMYTLSSVLAATGATDLLPLYANCTSNAQCASFWCQEVRVLDDGDQGYAQCDLAPGGHRCSAGKFCTTESCEKGSCARSEDGESCAWDSDCGQSLRCLDTNGEGYTYSNDPTCAASIGKPCSLRGDCGSLACDRGFCGKPGRGGTCLKDSDCLSSDSICKIDKKSACDYQDVSCLAVGNCFGLAALGQPCREDDACKSGRCGPSSKKTGLGTCMDPKTAPPKAHPTEKCYSDNDCLYATFDVPACMYPHKDHTATGTCDLQVTNEPCTQDRDCRNKNCQLDKVRNIKLCEPNKIGEYCTTDNDCLYTLYCNGGKCDPNRKCVLDFQCLKNYTCIAPPTDEDNGVCHNRSKVNLAKGKACKEDFQCLSYKCINSKCAGK